MAYITMDEVTTYCKIPTVTAQDLQLATDVIDAYKDRSFEPTNFTDMSKLRKRSGMGWGQCLSGRVLHNPIIAVTDITTQVPSPFGGLQTVHYPIESIQFDDDNSLYYTFYPMISSTPQPFTPPIPKVIRVSYSSGYEVIPEQVKYCCGVLADSINKNGGFNNYKARTDFDMSITFSSEGILTNDIKSLIDGPYLI